MLVHFTCFETGKPRLQYCQPAGLQSDDPFSSRSFIRESFIFASMCPLVDSFISLRFGGALQDAKLTGRFPRSQGAESRFPEDAMAPGGAMGRVARARVR